MSAYGRPVQLTWSSDEDDGCNYQLAKGNRTCNNPVSLDYFTEYFQRDYEYEEYEEWEREQAAAAENEALDYESAPVTPAASAAAPTAQPSSPPAPAAPPPTPAATEKHAARKPAARSAANPNVKDGLMMQWLTSQQKKQETTKKEQMAKGNNAFTAFTAAAAAATAAATATLGSPKLPQRTSADATLLIEGEEVPRAERQCYTCKQKKPPSAFWTRNLKDGRKVPIGACKVCRATKKAAYR